MAQIVCNAKNCKGGLGTKEGKLFKNKKGDGEDGQEGKKPKGVEIKNLQENLQGATL